MSKTLPTAAGHTELSGTENDLIDAISQVFTLFRINYHNQYYRAFPDEAVLNQAKKLWYGSLKNYDPRTLLEATKQIIEDMEYLPTLHQMLRRCSRASTGAPEPHAAYREACQAPSPKAGHIWSHPAVYEAGKRADWFFLSTTPEQYAYPVFKTRYEEVLNEVANGATLSPVAAPEEAEQVTEQALPREEGLKRVKQLRKLLG